jgi:hypothetical protein
MLQCIPRFGSLIALQVNSSKAYGLICIIQISTKHSNLLPFIGTNRQKKQLFVMDVGTPSGTTLPGNLTIIPSEQKWVFHAIYQLVFAIFDDMEKYVQKYKLKLQEMILLEKNHQGRRLGKLEFAAIDGKKKKNRATTKGICRLVQQHHQ